MQHRMLIRGLNRCVKLNGLSRCLSIGAEPKKKWQKVAIDRAGLLNRGLYDENIDPSTLLHKEPQSPLAKELHLSIKSRGPLTMHEYMAQCLNHSTLGYYQHKNAKIGSDGDFVTSPEISQLFGEMIGIWCVSVWEQLGKPTKLNIVELGPGKGTLMKDMLKVSERFKPFKDSLHVHFVELSQTMRLHQYDAVAKKGSLPLSQAIEDCVSVPGATGVPIQWYSFLKQVPSDNGPVIIIGQEFLDAFPIHQFAYTRRGWREKLIDYDTGSSKLHFRIVMAPAVTPAVSLLSSSIIEQGLKTSNVEVKLNRPQIEPPKIITKGAEVTIGQPNNTNSNSDSTQKQDVEYREGDSIEVSPLSISICEEIAERIVQSGGASLIIDYGENYTPADSLRGFKKHGQVSALSEPGLVDMTADVDFAMCALAATSKGVNVAPLSTQGDFLFRMGIVDRVQNLINKESIDVVQARQLIDGMRKLVDPEQMGKRFKVLGMSSPGLNIHGFPEAK